ncbi:MAG: type I secretion protein [Pseudomonadota bacterium]
MTMHDPTLLVGTGLSDDLDGTGQSDQIDGLAGDDTIDGAAGDDVLNGDYGNENLLNGTDDATGFTDYANSGDWQVSDLEDGHQTMSQTIPTEVGGVYSLGLDLAANFAGGRPDGAIEILVDGEVVATFSSQSGAYDSHSVQFTAAGTDTEVTIRSIDAGENGPEIDTSGPAFHYDHEMEIGGQTVTVAAFAEGQANLYQVLNGTLNVFDVETQTYKKAGADGTVNVNSMGFNAQDNLLYAIAVKDGTDSLGQAVKSSDLIMLDADGNSYRIGETPYRSWTGDFDDQGNLWSFDSSMDRVTVIDVDKFDADGNSISTVYKLPKEMIEFRVYDVAFDAASQTFYGVARPSKEGEATQLLVVDISSGTPEFSTISVTSTVIDGVVLEGVPAMTFGAAIIDADGNLFVGGNSGDHDMDNSTGSSGAIYQVIIDEATNEASLHLIEEAPTSYSNDGAADPTAQSPFADVDLVSSVLIRDLQLVATTEGELTYNDQINGNAGHDTLSGGIGTDTLTGGSAGDSLEGNDGNDNLHGGAGENSGSTIVSSYDEEGVRYDQYGNVLAEDDDILVGGGGIDTLSGSAGHDTLDGGSGDDILNGGSGSDVLIGGTGNDALSGGSESDQLSGGADDDVLEGDSGDDLLNGDSGADILKGGSGDDTLHGGDHNDLLEGGSGDDNLFGGKGNDTLDAGSGNDVLSGGDGNDSLDGKSGSDVLSGGEGTDTIKGGSGNDALDGGAGRDKLNGGSGNDVLSGGSGKDMLNGSSGHDTLDGGDDKDRLYMGAGDDVATGGEGADRFIFRSEDLDGSTDTIKDFSFDEYDSLDFRKLNLGANGSEIDQWFMENAKVIDGDDVHISLGNDTTLILEDVGADLGQLYDSIMF